MITYFTELDSTNSYALKNIQTLADQQVIVAERQTGGRGRLGREWLSENTQNLYFSIVLKPAIGLGADSPLTNITQYMAVILAQTLDVYLAPFALQAMIKWPNDLFVQKQKIAGILAEAKIQGEELVGYVLGVGINLNMTAAELETINQPAIALSELIKAPVDKKIFLTNLLKMFFSSYHIFLDTGFKFIQNDYQKKFYLSGQKTTLVGDSSKEAVLILGVNADGSIKVQTSQNVVKNLKTGELKW